MGIAEGRSPTIAYVVLAHTLPEQLARMVRALTFANVRFFVHIEASVSIEPFLKSLPPSPTVTYVDPRQDGHWGGFGIVRASLHGLRLAMSQSDYEPDFVGLLSGLDYPIHPPIQISQFLASHLGQSFIERQPLPVPGLRNGGFDRVECYSRSWRRRRYTYYPRQLLGGLNWRGRAFNAAMGVLLAGKPARRHPPYAAPHYGSQWWLISRQAAHAIFRFLERHRDFERFHEDSLLADELFFQTILASPENSHLFPLLVNQNLHFIRWPEGSSSPAVLGRHDLNALTISGRLFARKFDASLDPYVIDTLDERLIVRADPARRRPAPEIPVVSVRLIAYLQEPYIRQALESILSQRTDFPFELVIGEDNGPDGTRAICEEYARKDPMLIRLLPLAPRRGMVGNHLATLRACRGEFVALCDGDDYWIDPDKLQIQVDILRRHRDCSLSFHDAFAEYPDGRREAWLEKPIPAGYGAKDLFDEWVITTSSMVFRNPRLDTYPHFMEIATHEDLALMVFLARQGRIDYLDRPMSIYRRHPGSVMTTFKGIPFATRQIEFLREVDHWSNGDYSAPINRRIGGLMRSRALLWADDGERARAVREMASALRLTARPVGAAARDCARLSLELAGLGSIAARLVRGRKGRRIARERP